MTKTLWLPESARTEKFTCLLCDSTFDSRDRFRRHVGRCVKVNEPQPPERSAFNSYLDEEQVAWVKRRNREGKRLRGIVGGRQR